jgi:hypothetical protein
MPLTRRIVAEGVGTALLLAAIVGSGVMGERLAGGNVAIAPYFRADLWSTFQSCCYISRRVAARN